MLLCSVHDMDVFTLLKFNKLYNYGYAPYRGYTAVECFLKT